MDICVKEDKMMKKVLCFGSINIDYVYGVKEFIRPGETASSLSYDIFPGGKGFNQTIALARAGCKVWHGGRVGQDAQFMLDMMLEDGVDISCIDCTGKTTGHAVIQVNQDGQNCILVASGANGEISCQQIDQVIAQFEKGDILVVQNEVSNVEYLLTAGIQRGLQVYFNPSPVPENLVLPLGLHTLLINEVEGYELTNETEPEKIITLLLTRHPELRIVLTLGESGVIYADKHQQLSHPIFKTEVKDTTAAGDTFTGYYVASVLNQCSLEHTLHNACQAASVAVSRNGAAISIPYAKELSLK